MPRVEPLSSHQCYLMVKTRDSSQSALGLPGSVPKPRGGTPATSWGVPPAHPDPVATTWALSFEKIEKASPAAAELLRFCAFLHPDGIPEEVFSKGAPELGPVLESLGSNALAWNDALSEILKYSL